MQVQWLHGAGARFGQLEHIQDRLGPTIVEEEVNRSEGITQRLPLVPLADVQLLLQLGLPHVRASLLGLVLDEFDGDDRATAVVADRGGQPRVETTKDVTNSTVVRICTARTCA
jgi:hypothetical protein